MSARSGLVDALRGRSAEWTAFRRDIHRHAELGFREHRTAARIAEALESFGIEVTRGVGGTGVVGVLRAGTSVRSLGLRADMDALPMQERTGLPYASCNDGAFHGCGHDGHVAMLLAAAEELARTRRFDGAINFIFQPAEEGLGGARFMVEDGLFDRFPCDRIYALHNWPELPVGVVATRPGPIMAAADKFRIALSGPGGHAAHPHRTADAILGAAHLVTQLNAVTGRRVAPTEPAVLTVTTLQGGETHNVMPAKVTVGGTIRTFDDGVQAEVERALRACVRGVEVAFGLTASIDYERYYPVNLNDPAATGDALAALDGLVEARIAEQPNCGGEDFGFMLKACKGAYLWLGQAREAGAPGLHSAAYDFNDEVLPVGAAVHVRLAEAFLAAGERR